MDKGKGATQDMSKAMSAIQEPAAHATYVSHAHVLAVAKVLL